MSEPRMLEPGATLGSGSGVPSARTSAGLRVHRAQSEHAYARALQLVERCGLELAHGDATGDAEGFSLRAITGFFLGFGWVGFACSTSGYGAPVSSGAALVTGLVMMFGIKLALKSMKSLRSDGTVKYGDAIGSVATVYTTIQPAGAPGGQVTANFNNRQETLAAIQRGAEAIPAGTRVKIIATDASTMVVEKI